MRAGGLSGGNRGGPAVVCYEIPPHGEGELGVAQLADVQHGVVTHGQLLATGLTAKAIEHRVRVGRLHRLLRGVFAVRYGSLTAMGCNVAALLYAGEDAVLSHESAAAHWGMAPHPSFVAITVIGRRVRAQPGLRVHHTTTLDLQDVRLHHGLPVTSPARTLIDCAAGTLPIDRLLNEARALNLITDQDIHQAMERCPRRKGLGTMRALLHAERDTGFTRSHAERLLKRMVKQAGIETPILNSRVEGVEAEAYWPQHKLAVEVDGYQYHGRWTSFQSDRARDNRLVTAGYTVLRFTWHQLTQRPLYVLAQIVQMLTRPDRRAA